MGGIESYFDRSRIALWH